MSSIYEDWCIKMLQNSKQLEPDIIEQFKQKF